MKKINAYFYTMHDRDEADEKKPLGKPLKVGLSAAGIGSALVLTWHLLHGVQLVTEMQEKNEVKFESATIIITDSVTGEKDTMDLNEYMKQKNSNANK